MQLRPGTEIYYVPDHSEFTHTVFTDALRQIKGTDASWEHNNEPPQDVAEFSDDEEEKRWKARRRNKQQQSIHPDDETADFPCADTVPVPRKKLKARRGGSNRRRNNQGSTFRGSAFSHSNAYMHPYSVSQSPQPQPRSPWYGPVRPNDMHNFNSSVSPSSSNNWMWMSEETFRLPPPPLPHGFGRMRMALSPQVRMNPNVSSQSPPILTDHRFVQRNA